MYLYQAKHYGSVLLTPNRVMKILFLCLCFMFVDLKKKCFIEISDECLYSSTGYLEFSGSTLSPLTLHLCRGPTLCWKYMLIFLLLWSLPVLTDSCSSSQGPHVCDLSCLCCSELHDSALCSCGDVLAASV